MTLIALPKLTRRCWWLPRRAVFGRKWDEISLADGTRSDDDLGAAVVRGAMSAEHVADQVLAAGAALAGLLLVFLSNALAGYAGYSRTAQNAVRAQFRRRGWLAFFAFASALISCLLSLAYDWDKSEPTVIAAAVLLVLAFGLGLIAAIVAVTDIRWWRSPLRLSSGWTARALSIFSKPTGWIGSRAFKIRGTELSGRRDDSPWWRSEGAETNNWGRSDT
jgi:hypothetical protein